MILQKEIPYIDCAGVNVPDNLTLDELKQALAKRRKSLPNEEAVITAFNAIKNPKPLKRRRKK